MLKKLFNSITQFRKSIRMAELEMYIVSHNPQNNGDVERLTRQYHQKQSNYFNRMV
jgi:hypothetical protein